MPLSYIEISKRSLLSNLETFRKIIPNSKIICVLKANAYGHGIKEVAKILHDQDVWLQVDDIEELREIRSVSDKKTLVLGYIQPSDLMEAIKLSCSIAVYDIETLKLINSCAESLSVTQNVHIMIDTLMGREGFLESEIPNIIKEASRLNNISIEGLYGHFSNIDSFEDNHHFDQVKVFNNASHMLIKELSDRPIKHMSATAGILMEKDNKYNFARLGIGLYGIWPSIDVEKKGEIEGINIYSVMRWVSHVAQIKELPPKFPVGYGMTYITKDYTKIALIPQGYSDGYDRNLSNKGKVLINGMECSVIGRVSMNMMVVDVTGKEVKKGDEVILMGRSGSKEINVKDLADKCETIPYEIISRISPVIPRIIIE